MRSNLNRFAPDVRDRAALFEREFGILALAPEGLTLEAINAHEADILADFERISDMPLALYLHRGGHREPLTKGYHDPAVERHYQATKAILLRGKPVCWDAAFDHQDRLRRETGRPLIVNGSVWLGPSPGDVLKSAA